MTKKERSGLLEDEKGTAVVEATILFPVIFMIFFGIVILAMFLPTRAVLQYATQYAATALATERSDTWLEYDESAMAYRTANDRSELDNVYVAFFGSVASGDYTDKANTIVAYIDDHAAIFRRGNLEVRCFMNNYVLYKEIVVTARRSIPTLVNFEVINFPKEIPITVSSTAVIQNGDEFIRNLDLAVDVINWARTKNEGINKVFTSLETARDKFSNFLELG